MRAILPERLRRAALCGALLAVAVSGCSDLLPPSIPGGIGSTFLTVDGDSLRLGSVPVRLRGVNFNNEPALSCCGGPDIGSIDVAAPEYAQVAAWGGNVIRFGLDYAWYASDRARFLSVLDRHVGFARANHLWMLPVLYEPPGGGSGGFHQDCLWRACPQGAENRRRLIDFWVDVARHLEEQPAVAGYDLLNEPAPASDAEWYLLAQRLHDAMGAADPHHLVVVESTEGGHFSRTLTGSNVVYSVHEYAPLSFTMSREADTRAPCPVYPGPCEGREWDRATIAQSIRDGEVLDVDFSRRHHVPLLVGEFGAEKSNGYTRWVSDEEDAYEQFGVHWIVFVIREPGAEFGLYTCGGAGDLDCPDTALIAVQRAHMAGSVRP